MNLNFSNHPDGLFRFGVTSDKKCKRGSAEALFSDDSPNVSVGNMTTNDNLLKTVHSKYWNSPQVKNQLFIPESPAQEAIKTPIRKGPAFSPRIFNNLPNKDKIIARLNSPSAFCRMQALRALRSPVPSEEETTDEEIAELFLRQAPKKAQFIEDVLTGVIAYVEVRSGREDRSEGVKCVLRSLGATVKDKLLKDVTHVVFGDGVQSTYNKATARRLHLVSVLWVDACKRNMYQVSEKLYPPYDCKKYDSPGVVKTYRKIRAPTSQGKKRAQSNKAKAPIDHALVQHAVAVEQTPWEIRYHPINAAIKQKNLEASLTIQDIEPAVDHDLESERYSQFTRYEREGMLPLAVRLAKKFRNRLLEKVNHSQTNMEANDCSSEISNTETTLSDRVDNNTVVQLSVERPCLMKSSYTSNHLTEKAYSSSKSSASPNNLNVNDKPATTDSDKPGTTESDKPATTDSDKPATTDSDKPATTDTDSFVSVKLSINKGNINQTSKYRTTPKQGIKVVNGIGQNTSDSVLKTSSDITFCSSIDCSREQDNVSKTKDASKIHSSGLTSVGVASETFQLHISSENDKSDTVSINKTHESNCRINESYIDYHEPSTRSIHVTNTLGCDKFQQHVSFSSKSEHQSICVNLVYNGQNQLKMPSVDGKDTNAAENTPKQVISKKIVFVKPVSFVNQNLMTAGTGMSNVATDMIIKQRLNKTINDSKNKSSNENYNVNNNDNININECFGTDHLSVEQSNKNRQIMSVCNNKYNAMEHIETSDSVEPKSSSETTCFSSIDRSEQKESNEGKLSHLQISTSNTSDDLGINKTGQRNSNADKGNYRSIPKENNFSKASTINDYDKFEQSLDTASTKLEQNSCVNDKSNRRCSLRISNIMDSKKKNTVNTLNWETSNKNVVKKRSSINPRQLSFDKSSNTKLNIIKNTSPKMTDTASTNVTGFANLKSKEHRINNLDNMHSFDDSKNFDKPNKRRKTTSTAFINSTNGIENTKNSVEPILSSDATFYSSNECSGSRGQNKLNEEAPVISAVIDIEAPLHLHISSETDTSDPLGNNKNNESYSRTDKPHNHKTHTKNNNPTESIETDQLNVDQKSNSVIIDTRRRSLRISSVTVNKSNAKNISTTQFTVKKPVTHITEAVCEISENAINSTIQDTVTLPKTVGVIEPTSSKDTPTEISKRNKKRKLYHPNKETELIYSPTSLLKDDTVVQTLNPYIETIKKAGITQKQSVLTLGTKNKNVKTKTVQKSITDYLTEECVHDSITDSLNIDLSSVQATRRSTLEFIQKPSRDSLIRIQSQRPAVKSIIPGLVCTCTSFSEMKLVEKVVKDLGGFVVSNTVNKDTTHIIATEPRRTIKILKGIVKGCWLLNFNWVKKSQDAGKWLEEEDFEWSSFSPAVQRTRIERLSFGSSFQMDLFSGYGDIYASRSCVPPWKDIEQLITQCGGTIAKTSRSAQIVIGERVRDQDITCVSTDWILHCITVYKRSPLHKYML